MAEAGTVLEVKDLKTHFFLDEGVVKAVDGISFVLNKGQTLGIVGESGCGKSVASRSILQLVGSAGKIVDGQILFRHNGTEIDLARFAPASEEIRRIRGKEISMIFQEPMTAFSPVYTVGTQITEVILCHLPVTKREARERAISLLAKVGIAQPERRVDAYPFELSGGMRQRAMIAMALACSPIVLIADEPTTALDVTIQAQILDLLREMQQEYGMSIILITHNMGVIAEMADDVAVMYLGKVVEYAPVWELFENPLHPYTIALLKSIPMVDGEMKDRLESIKGNLPDPYNLPSGCRFHPRCPAFMAGICDQEIPPMIEVSPRHFVSCFLMGGARGAE